MKLKSTHLFLIIIGIITLIIGIILLIKLPRKENYDVSFMHEATVEEVLDMFSDNKMHVVMFGYSKCSECQRILPAVKDAQIKNNYMTSYLDIEKIDRSSSNWSKLKDKFTLKSTQTLTEDGSGEKVTETYGYFLDEYGMTPTIIIIKDNKQVAGTIGGNDYNILLNWLIQKTS